MPPAGRINEIFYDSIYTPLEGDVDHLLPILCFHDLRAHPDASGGEEENRGNSGG